MANYPSSLRQSNGSREIWYDPIELDDARSGAAKGRRLQSAKKRRFIVRHESLTEAEKQTLETFYDANRATTFLFAWNKAPGTTYTVIFADKEGLDWTGQGVHNSVAVELREA